MNKILMIEDDRGLVRVIGDRLRAEGYDLKYVTDGETGLETALKGHFDLMLVDLMLPGISGFDIIRELRSKGNLTPVIITSAKFQMSDKVSGLRLGADDYLVKPFEFDELLARIEAQLRRYSYAGDGGSEVAGDWLDMMGSDYSFDSFTLSFKNCGLKRERESISLSHMEFRLLAYLVQNRERVVSTEELLEKIWHYEDTVSTRTLYVHIAWLRKKLQSGKNGKEYIKTIRGLGYRFTA